MRAPPLSRSPTTGVRDRVARSITMEIFWAWTAPRDPPSAVGSWANRPMARPSTVTVPVTTPSPSGRLSAMPKAVLLCRAVDPNSMKESGSANAAIRSLASGAVTRT